MTGKLGPLINYLEGLTGRASLGELTAHLADADVTCEDVAEFVRFSEKQYARNLVRAGEWYYLLVLCWRNGQRSPIHDHAGSSCGVRVLRGAMTETVFRFAPNGAVLPMGSRELSAGGVCGSEDSDMHQVSNLQAGSADLVTLHVYSPPLRYMNTYSITGEPRGQEPMLVEFCDAAGI
jgi:cysteine dioxygenase